MAPESLPAPKLLTAKQTATATALSPRKIWALTASGELRCVRIGRSVRYDVADVAAFIERSKTK